MSAKRVTLTFKHAETGEIRKASYEARWVPAKIWQSELEHHTKEIDDLIQENTESREALISQMRTRGFLLVQPT